MSRKKKAIKSIAWSTISALIGGFLGPVSYIFKARFLSPDEIGVVAILMVIVGLVVQIISSGFSQAVVEREDLSEEAFSSFYVINIAFGIIVGVLLYLLSKPIALIYDMPDLVLFLRLSALQFLFVSLGNPYKGIFQRILNFKLLSIIDICKAVLLFILTVYLLFNDYKILSIVYANIITALFGSILLIIFGLKENIIGLRLYYSTKSFKPFMYFLTYYSGKLSSTYLTQNVDALIIGLFLPDYVLGLYYFAKNMIDKFRMLLTNSLTSFLFPFFAEIKSDFERVRNTYLKTLDMMSLISFVISFYIFSSANSYVLLLFGEEWAGSIIVFQVLALTMVFTLVTNNISTSILYARGKVKSLFYLDIVSNAIFLISLFVFSKYGLEYVLGIRFIFVAVTSTAIQYLANKDLNIKIIELLKLFTKRFSVSLILTITCYFLFNITYPEIHYVYEFVLMSLIFLVGYLLYTSIFEWQKIIDIKNIIRSKGKSSS